MSVKGSIFEPPIDLRNHSSLIYAEGVFGLDSRKKFSMRAKTADGILRYADYEIAGVVDSQSREKTAGEVLRDYLAGRENFKTPIFSDLKEARQKTNADVLILGAAREGGAFPKEWEKDIELAMNSKMHLVSGTHFSFAKDERWSGLAKKNNVLIWDARMVSGSFKIPVGSARAYYMKKPVVLTVGMDAAIGKMTVAYEMSVAAKGLGMKSCVIPTGQTAIIIEGWGVSIDALPADFMAGAVETMLLEKEEDFDIFFVEGQGSLFHPAFSNTCISLIHGAVPTHMVLVHRPQREHSIGSKLVKLPSIKEAIYQYEGIILPRYRNAKVIAVALNSSGMGDEEYSKYKESAEKESGLPVFDAVRERGAVAGVISNLKSVSI